MNKLFAEHTTNTAFFLSMSKNQVRWLLALEAKDMKPIFEYGRTVPTFDRLHIKGLVNYRPGVLELTEAGRLMCALLREAGFKHRMTVVQEAA